LTEHEGQFKVATLRNIDLTGPYMHDGSLASLEEVIDHYASGGSQHPLKSDLIKGFVISASDKAALIAFLESLTDTVSYKEIY
jgi:cytochrome c peroxidase